MFVRFALCNLACPWCDTDFTKRFSLSLEELLAEIARFAQKNVILTGGEPTFRDGMEHLVAALKERGYWIAIETNGTKGFDEAPYLAFLDYIACSPKVEFEDSLRLDRADEVRVVASSREAIDFCRRIERKIAAKDYYVSPCDRDGKIDFALAKDVLGELDGWALSVQLHKLLGFR